MEEAVKATEFALEGYPYKKVKDLLASLKPDMEVEAKIEILNFLLKECPQVRAYKLLFETLVRKN